MDRDFTLKVYAELINKFILENYQIQTFNSYLLSPHDRSIILRHDVDNKPERALEMALIEANLGV